MNTGAWSMSNIVWIACYCHALLSCAACCATAMLGQPPRKACPPPPPPPGPPPPPPLLSTTTRTRTHTPQLPPPQPPQLQPAQLLPQPPLQPQYVAVMGAAAPAPPAATYASTRPMLAQVRTGVGKATHPQCRSTFMQHARSISVQFLLFPYL